MGIQSSRSPYRIVHWTINVLGMEVGHCGQVIGEVDSMQSQCGENTRRVHLPKESMRFVVEVNLGR
jgi:hypothetical protein